MTGRQERSVTVTMQLIGIVGGVFLLVATTTTACDRTGTLKAAQGPSTLRIGTGQINIDQFLQFFSVEGLAKVTEDGRLDTRLAKSWNISDDRLSITVTLRLHTLFHDGTPVTAEIVAASLRQGLPPILESVYDDVASIDALGESQVRIVLKRASAFVLEALEVPISKPGHADVGTGPFKVISSAPPAELRANSEYYLGQPGIDRIAVTMHPSQRAAWAELLRDHLDMVYEVGVDARDSLQDATSIVVFPYVRHYQYVIQLNPHTPALKSPEVRRALNEAIDREAVVRDGMFGYGLPSKGPVALKHWAAQDNLPTFKLDPKGAAVVIAAIGHPVKFTCLVAADDERVALVVKRQLASVGVEMVVEEGTIRQNQEALLKHNFDAILWSAISGPTLFRPYRWWHSKGSLNRGGYSSPAVDAALDAVRHSTSDAEYRDGVIRFQQAILDDPPAIFLAWDEHGRAVSNRFQVPPEPGGGDVFGTLRLWRPVGSPAHATN